MWMVCWTILMGFNAPAPGDFQLGDCAFLTGVWVSQGQDVMQEEHWMSPAGGIMVGMHRDVRPNGSSFFEFLHIEQRADGIYYLASPRGKAPIAFKLIEKGSDRVVFENPNHDFPQKIIYVLREGKLVARIEGLQDGELSAMEWQWSSVDAVP